MNKIKIAFRLYVLIIEFFKMLMKRDYAYERKKFIKEGSLLYGCKYNYKKMDFRSLNASIVIECPFHGNFVVDPAKNHIDPLIKSECPICTFNKDFEELKNNWEQLHTIQK
ncbi:hypothetical protein [Proteus mirabilis]|uniref:hypothetical protein n=1 Tax=Proteus mirabilis TaxID=584 RepID=UPI0034D3FFC4